MPCDQHTDTYKPCYVKERTGIAYRQNSYLQKKRYAT